MYDPCEFTEDQKEWLKKNGHQICDAENTAYRLACILCKNEDLKCTTIRLLGKIIDAAKTVLQEEGFQTNYPLSYSRSDDHKRR